MAKNRFFAIVSNGKKHHYDGDFVCGLQFAFDPPMCVGAGPKVENLFLHRGLDKCKRIAELHGFRFTVHNPPEHTGDRSKAMYHCGRK